MSEITVRVLGVGDWERYKEIRLRALQESPEAFVATYDAEAAYGDDVWQERMSRSSRLLAERDGNPIGIVSVRGDEDLFEGAAEVFGLWVPAELRGGGVAARLVEAAAKSATEQGHGQLVYWVGTDNGRGVAFASSYGFRPTEYRRPVRVKNDDGEEELAMVLALSR